MKIGDILIAVWAAGVSLVMLHKCLRILKDIEQEKLEGFDRLETLIVASVVGICAIALAGIAFYLSVQGA